MTFAQRLSELMNKNNLTNYQLAKELDIHPSTIANWLNGKEPRKKTLALLASYFGVSVDYLLGNEETKIFINGVEESRDVKPMLTYMKSTALEGITLMYDGEPIDESTMRAFEASLEAAIAILEARKQKRDKGNEDKNKKAGVKPD